MPSRHGRLAAEYRVHDGGGMGKGMTENRMSIKSGILLVRNWTGLVSVEIMVRI